MRDTFPYALKGGDLIEDDDMGTQTTTVDRTGEYDQTKRHVHDAAAPPCCDDDVLELKLNRPVSPVILEHRIQKLEQENRALRPEPGIRERHLERQVERLERENRVLRDDVSQWATENELLRQRILSFERLSATLSTECDRLLALLKNGVQIEAKDVPTFPRAA